MSYPQVYNVRFRALTTKKSHDAARHLPLLRTSLGTFMEKHGDKVIKRMQWYPPALSPTYYRREWKGLKGGWRKALDKHPSGWVLYIWNVMKYWIWVQGKYQTARHRDAGWLTLESQLDRSEYQKGIRKIYTDFALKIRG